MARFYGSMSGQARGEVTRMGGAASGVKAHVRGWTVGGEVRAHVDPKGNDLVSFYLTCGSQNAEGELLLEVSDTGTVYVADKLRQLLAKLEGVTA